MTSALPSIVTTSLGPIGKGSNFFRCGVVHSSGVVYIGTYGPQPAIIWKYDPAAGKLEKVAEPGEYQLDSMVEAPSGAVYIGTAYGGLVYKLDPATGQVVSLGSPAIESTPWIFTMIRTRRGEVYGAKGVGLFRLDWNKDRFEAIGLVPGNHRTAGFASEPIVRQLDEAPDGSIWGGTNRWLFRFIPSNGKIEPVADMAEVDDACYSVVLPGGGRPAEDCYFAIMPRFSNKTVKTPFHVYRNREKRIDSLPIDGLSGEISAACAWSTVSGQPRLLTGFWDPEAQRARVAVIDPAAGRVAEWWSVEGNAITVLPLSGGGLHFISLMTGGLLRADPAGRRLKLLAENPMPVECRCLASSPKGVLGTDTYDCGHAFTLDLSTRKTADHGKVWADEHRCNYGPAAFAGRDGRYLLANHSEGLPSLWVTDLDADRHWRVGEAAAQLVAAADGSVWGTTGPNPPTTAFDPAACWTPAWQARPGAVFRYRPGEPRVELVAALGKAGPLAEAPGLPGAIVAARGKELWIYEGGSGRVVQKIPVAGNVLAAAHTADRRAAYFVFEEGSLWACVRGARGWEVREAAARYGAVDRGFFVLPRSGRVVGIASGGTVTVFDPRAGAVGSIEAPPPLAAGPAVDLDADAWYFADREVVRHELR